MDLADISFVNFSLNCLVEALVQAVSELYKGLKLSHECHAVIVTLSPARRSDE